MAESGPPPSEIGPPEGWDNFANNLGSDLAPLLALFGEQVTKQYLSESLSWLDCVLFAIAPLGIITAMVAAIRVAGEPWLRSLIGRAKESRGDVEAELMSSTSSDVCELWNGDGIVRFLGSPVLLHLIHLDSTSGMVCTCNTSYQGQPNNTNKIAEPAKCTCACAEDKAWTYTFHEAITLGLYTTKDQNNEPVVKLAGYGVHGGQGPSSHANTDVYDDSDIEDLRSSRQNPPNLSLNVSVKPLDPRILVFLGTIGILLQAGVLLWAAFSQYGLKLHKNDLPPVPYGFPIYAVGTVVLALGMFGCAWVVESSTCEAIWEPSSASAPTPTTTTMATAEHGSNYSVLWLQQGGQIVGDQRFESWSRRAVFPENKITTSHKSAKPVESKSRRALVNTTITLAFVGFVCQFFGLRVLHSSVTLAQLGAILVMTLIRCFGHIQRENLNDINDPEQVEGHELDWLAKDLKKCDTWEVITSAGPTDEEEGSLTLQKTVSSKYAISTLHVPSATDVATASAAAAAGNVMKIRARLARLSKDWELEIRTTVGILQNAIEMTMKEVFAHMKLSKDFKNESTFEWVISVKTEFKNIQPGDPTYSKRPSEIKLTLRREKDDNHNWRAWKIEASELEAVLCLWVSSLTNIDKIRAKLSQRRLKQIRLVGLATEGAQVDYKLWIHRGTTASQTALNYATARYFGRVTGMFDRDNKNTQLSSIDPNSNSNSTPPIEYLYADATGSLEIICAQDLYTSFLFQLLRKVEDVGGITTRRKDSSSVTPASGSTTASSNDSWSQFRLDNSNLATITGIFEECGLVNNVEDAYLCIVPAFRSANKLPSPHAAYYEARRACAKLAKDGEWAKVIAIDAWLYTNSKKIQASRFTVIAITAEITSRLRRASEELVADFKSDPNDDVIYAVWNLAYSLCCTIIEASEDVAATLVNLYKICPKVKSSIHPDVVFRHTFQVARGLDVGTTEIIRNLYHLRLSSISTDEIEKYLSDPKSLKATADADVSGLDDDDQVPIGFRLARGYRTPLQMAAEIGHQAIVEMLLLAGADINGAAAAVDGRTALQAAAGGGHKEIVEILLAANADVNSRPELEGAHRGHTTALQAASGGGHKEVVQILLDAGADCNAPPASNGRTALQAAAKGGHTEIVKLLLDYNADVNTLPAAEGGQTAVRAAAIGGHTEVVALLIDAKADLGYVQDKPGPLQGAAGAGHKEIVKLLLDAGADVNNIPPRDLNPLQSAASGGHKEIVQILLDAGADVNTSWGSALKGAARAGHKEVVGVLLGAGANVNMIWKFSERGALAVAAAGGGHQEILQVLLDARASINAEPIYARGTALKMAAGAGHKEVVEMLLAAKADVNILGNRLGQTALQVAAEGGYHEVVELLLAFGPDLNTGPVYGRQTALQAAAAGGHEGVVELLLDAGADANIVTADGGRNALQLAAEGGHKGVVRLLLDARVDLNPISADKGNTPLQAAAYGGHDEVVDMLLESGANVNEKREGRRVLEIAAAEGHLEVVKLLLLKAKAAINALSKHDGLERTALQAAVAGGHTNVVKLLLQAKANVNAAAGRVGRTALQEAVKCRDKEMIHLLLAAKADIEGKPGEDGGRTALQTAAWSGQKELVEILLVAKANVNAPPAAIRGRTALQTAAEGGHKEVVELLLAAKAYVNAPPSALHGRTALQAACGKGHMQVVELLLVAKADPNAPASASWGRTALQAAAHHGKKEVVELLLTKGADVHTPAVGNYGKTALQAASQSGHEVIVELLLAAGADVNAQPAYFGRTALQAAAAGGHQKVVTLLLAAGANINAPPAVQLGRTALQLAEDGQHWAILELLQEELSRSKTNDDKGWISDDKDRKPKLKSETTNPRRRRGSRSIPRRKR